MALMLILRKRRAALSQSERVVVIGGAGFIGSRLTLALANAGCHVVVVSRSSGGRRSSNPCIEYHSGRVADRDRMSQLIAGASVVYDLSMAGGATWEDWKREVIDAAVSVAEICLDRGVRRLIYT